MKNSYKNVMDKVQQLQLHFYFTSMILKSVFIFNIGNVFMDK